ncbi:hypothetical protein Z517_01040 [Fonsecaea pedrosoi CBS 271.37]|uniref:SHSP domain-containing protein n=1 Tax=Fonsecaea pedrosoi CBS 271.37 TaxID=1442368 RepID=A0A0D2GX76_9EURO|nr:uncharacterized protein Z517_01040 [Fonsecaea pedrosoi CBS 271.37]KIW85648.1 hypothetical protein Z517_01040 [Fonsecaea pedrosoi CBS 271.37]
MAAGWYYLPSDIIPYPTTNIAHTYPEPGHHLHHIPVPYVAHKVLTKFHDKDEDIHQPKTDVRETQGNFYLEIELPGVKDHSELRLRWTTERTLLLTSKTHRSQIPEEELVEEPGQPKPEAAAPAPAPTETAAPAPAAPPTTTIPPAPEATQDPKTTGTDQTPKKFAPHLTLSERQIGEMVRAFNFPVDVDRDNTHAKLDAGLLRIVVPKVTEHGEAKHIHVPIHLPSFASSV